MKKMIFLLMLPLFFSFQQDKAKKYIVIVAYREPEMMYGKVKQVIELRPDKKVEGDIPQLVSDDTTLFNQIGDPIRTSFGEKGYAAGDVTYHTKYDSSQIRLETAVYVDLKTIYYFDSNGRVTKREEPGPTQPISLVLYHYNSLGELGSYEDYDYYNALRSRVSFEYDFDRFLAQKVYRHGNDHWNVNYTYLSFDPKGNWTKRIVMTDGGHADTVERKITYY